MWKECSHGCNNLGSSYLGATGAGSFLFVLFCCRGSCASLAHITVTLGGFCTPCSVGECPKVPVLCGLYGHTTQLAESREVFSQHPKRERGNYFFLLDSLQHNRSGSTLTFPPRISGVVPRKKLNLHL